MNTSPSGNVVRRRWIHDAKGNVIGSDTIDEEEEEGGNSVSDSEGASTNNAAHVNGNRRAEAQARYLGSIEKLLGSCGANAGRHPAGSPQYEADLTVASRWFDEVIWPPGALPMESLTRLDTLTNLIEQAKRGKKKPMAWLTSMVTEKFTEPPGGAE